MVCWLNNDHGMLTLDRQTPIFCKSHWCNTCSNTLCHPPSASLKTEAAEKQQDKESRWQSVSTLQTCIKKRKERPSNDYYAPIHQHQSPQSKLDVAWGALELALPGEGEMNRHVSKTALIWLCAQWLQQQVFQTVERGEVGVGVKHAKCI